MLIHHNNYQISLKNPLDPLSLHDDDDQFYVAIYRLK